MKALIWRQEIYNTNAGVEVAAFTILEELEVPGDVADGDMHEWACENQGNGQRVSVYNETSKLEYDAVAYSMDYYMADVDGGFERFIVEEEA